MELTSQDAFAKQLSNALNAGYERINRLDPLYPRKKLMREKVLEIGLQQQLSFSVNFYKNEPSFSHAYNFAAADNEDESDKKILIHEFFLIEPDDIPEELRLTSESDPRIFDFSYLNQISGIIRQTFRIEINMANETHKEMFTLLLQLMVNPEKYKLAREFILAHEISHLFHNHQKNIHLAHPKKWSLAKCIMSLAVGILFGRTIPSPMHRVVYGIAFSAITLHVINLLQKFFTYLKTCSHGRACEKEADLKAAHVVGAEGGIYFFEMFRKHNVISLKDPSMGFFEYLFLNMMIDKKGNDRFSQFISPFNSHPSCYERESYLNVISKHCANAEAGS